MSLYTQDVCLIEKVKEIRKKLHEIPEYSHEEVETAALVESYLRKTNPDYLYAGVGGHGIVAGYEGAQGAPSKMFRCELDAIKTSEGIRHWCGHDGHMSIMLGLSHLLAENRSFNGTVWLLFQPAEEIGEGAALMSKELEKLNIHFDYSFALHNKPGVPLNKVILHKEVYAAGSVGMEVYFKGMDSHASNPEKAVSPYRAICDTAEYLLDLNQSSELFEDFTLGTIVNISMGDINYGVTPGKGYLRITLRSFKDKDLEKICYLMEEYANSKARECSLDVVVSYFDRFPATVNDDEANSMIEKALLANHIDFEYASEPEKASDDYAFFAFNSVSSYFDIGNGTDMEDLHQKGYRFSDEIIETALRIYSYLVYDK